MPAISPLCSQSGLEDEKICAKKPPNSCRLIFAFMGIKMQAPRISPHRQFHSGNGKTIIRTADPRFRSYPVSTPQYCLLREYIPIPPAICLKAVADVLLLLHVHVVKLVDWNRIRRTRSAGREGARWTLW